MNATSTMPASELMEAPMVTGIAIRSRLFAITPKPRGAVLGLLRSFASKPRFFTRYISQMTTRARNSLAVTPMIAPIAAYSGPLGRSFTASARPMPSLPSCSTIWETAVPVICCMPCRYPRYAHMMETNSSAGANAWKER